MGAVGLEWTKNECTIDIYNIFMNWTISVCNIMRAGVRQCAWLWLITPLHVCGGTSEILHASLFVRICKPGRKEFELQIAVEGATEDISQWKQHQQALPTSSQINCTVMITVTIKCIFTFRSFPQHSLGSTDLTSCLCLWVIVPDNRCHGWNGTTAKGGGEPEGWHHC